MTRKQTPTCCLNVINANLFLILCMWNKSKGLLSIITDLLAYLFAFFGQRVCRPEIFTTTSFQFNFKILGVYDSSGFRKSSKFCQLAVRFCCDLKEIWKRPFNPELVQCIQNKSSGLRKSCQFPAIEKEIEKRHLNPELVQCIQNI